MTVRFDVSNLLISLVSPEILPRRDGVALNLLRHLYVADIEMFLFLGHPAYPSWARPTRLETREQANKDEERIRAW